MSSRSKAELLDQAKRARRLASACMDSELAGKLLDLAAIYEREASDDRDQLKTADPS
jgi:hypothetical protein